MFLAYIEKKVFSNSYQMLSKMMSINYLVNITEDNFTFPNIL